MKSARFVDDRFETRDMTVGGFAMKFFWSYCLLGGGSGAFAEVKAVLDIEKAPKKGETLVWSPLFQASWDKLNGIHGGLPERVEPANVLITKLNQFEWKEKTVMPEGGYGVFAGPGSAEFARETAAKVKERFGVEMEMREQPDVEGGVSVYGILVRDLSFQKSFFRSKKKLLSFKNSRGVTHKVTFFGTTGSMSGRFGNSVEVLDYQLGKKVFVLKVKTEKEGESLIIYRPEAGMSFEKGIEGARAAIKSPFDGKYGSLTDGGLHKFDTVKIPYLSLDAKTDFTKQLQGLRFYQKESVPWRISEAYQVTQFELFEKGARIKVVTSTADDPFGGPSKKFRYVRRNFVCDGPFFVFAWRDGAEWPYFAAWIDGKDALKKGE